jgi:hypothetical protein
MTIRGFTSENRKKKNLLPKKESKSQIVCFTSVLWKQMCFYFVFLKEKKFTSEKRK